MPSDYLSDVNTAIRVLMGLKPGQRYVYYIGSLDAVRHSNPRSPEAIIANAAYSFMLNGRIHLTQRRLGPPVISNRYVDWSTGIGPGFEYIATGATPKHIRIMERTADEAG